MKQANYPPPFIILFVFILLASLSLILLSSHIMKIEKMRNQNVEFNSKDTSDSQRLIPRKVRHLISDDLVMVDSKSPWSMADANEIVQEEENQIISNNKNGNDYKRMKIAVAITVTKDGPYLDGAAILQHSMRMTKSRHDIEFVAIVHKDVQTTRSALASLGFKIMEFLPPIVSSEIKGKHLRETIDGSGCCGAMELLKIRAYQLVEYDRVLVMDMDAIFLKNIDHLFEVESVGKSLLYTKDIAMDNPGSKAPPVQGGFLLITPSNDVYEEIIGIVREGDFRPGSGWGGLGIGWCWGGQTVQGVLAYYYTIVAKDTGLALNHCTYNAMVSTKDCEKVDYNDVYSVHFTVCQKPWECHKGDFRPLCPEFHTAWWRIREDLEKTHGLPVTPRCCRDKALCPVKSYKEIDLKGISH